MINSFVLPITSSSSSVFAMVCPVTVKVAWELICFDVLFAAVVCLLLILMHPPTPYHCLLHVVLTASVYLCLFHGIFSIQTR